MDVNRFSDESPGEVVSIGHGEHAFIPAPLPPNWAFPPSLWPILSEAKQQIGILEGIGRNLPNPSILLRPLADREAIRSSSLEGTYATPRELLLYELDPKEATSARDPLNDQREVFNYRRALNHGTSSELPLSLRLIRELHQILMTGVRGKDKTPGEFRRQQVAIGSSRRFVPPPPHRMAECLDPLEKALHANDRFDPLVQCFLVHYQFEAIHPFNDGNGRVGRLLMAIMLQQKSQLSKPWMYLSEFFERYRDEYVHHLFNISSNNNWHDWVEFCLRGALTQAQETIARCERLLAIRDSFAQRIADVGGSVRLSQIVEDIFHSPFVQVAALSRRLEVTYPTAKADIDRLVEANILQELPGVNPKTYFAPEVFNVSYEELSTDET